MYNQNRLLDIYYDLIRINSISGNERELAEFIANKLGDMGLEVNWSYCDGHDSPSIYTKLEGTGEGPTLLLIGHLDTVDIARGWNTDPFEPIRKDDKVYGLGAMDMKSGISAILETIKTIKDEMWKLKGDIIVAFVSDEEVKSRGTYKLIKEGLNADMAIMAECRFNNPAIGFRGRCNIIVEVLGEAAHASKYPTLGDNAIIKACELVKGIENLPTKEHPKLGKGSWCVRNIRGGTKKTLSVPDKCELFVDRYIVPGETFEGCMQQIIDLAKKRGIEVNVSLEERPTPFMKPFVISEEHKLVKTIKEKYEKIVKHDFNLEYDKSVCDSNFLVTIADIPTITFGPSGENMHAANEYGFISQIENVTQIYLETIQELLS